MTEPAALRVAVVGARRSRQGTGPFLALQAARAGARIVGIATRRQETAHQARAWLAAREVECPAFAPWQALLDGVQADAVIVAGPSATHEACLAECAERRLHVLCEKPLLHRDASDRVRELAARFADVHCVLAENCQWPWTLDGYRALHPGLDLTSATHFEMTMAPPGAGPERWIEMLSHPLSLLQATAPGAAQLESVVFSGPNAGTLRFGYLAGGRRVDCRVRAAPAGAVPRPASYGWDGRMLHRVVEQPGYRFFFDDGRGRRVAGADPMPRRVSSFLGAVSAARAAGRAPADEDLIRRQILLWELMRSYPG